METVVFTEGDMAVYPAHGVGVIKSIDLPQDLVDLELNSYKRPDNSLLSLEELEQDYISHILKITGGARTKAAEMLGINRASLLRKIKKYNLE